MKPATLTLATTAILLSIACGVHQTGKDQTQRPNILLIVSDDVGYADIGSYGGRDIPTPNIDRVAREGIRFTNAYVSGPYCSPTRAGLMTGRYPQRFGYEFNPDGSPEYGLPLTVTTMADRLKAAGYRTAPREGPLVDVDPSKLRDLSDAGLYNLSEDIGETRNRAAERPDKVMELSDLWQQWNRQLAKPSWAP